MHLGSLAAAFTLSFGPLLCAQTLVVDEAGGAGSHFRDLPPAIAAAPDGATLHVRPGNYTPFALAAKSLDVVVEDPALTWLRPGNVTIGPLTATQSVRIAGLSLDTDAALIVHDCAGEVTLDQQNRGRALVPSSIVIDNCVNVHLLRVAAGHGAVAGLVVPPSVTITRSNVEIALGDVAGHTALNPGVAGGTGLHVAQGSHVTLVHSNIAGGGGSASAATAAGHGGTAVHVEGRSVVDAGFGTAVSGVLGIAGGPGGSSFGGGPGGNGGAGVVVANGSFVRLFGDPLVAGAAGFGTPPGVAGARQQVDGASVFQWEPQQRVPIAVVIGEVAPARAIELRMYAAEFRGSPTLGVLLLGRHADYLQVAPLAYGVLGVVPVLTLGPVLAPAGGWASVPIQVPAGWPRDTVLTAQFVALHPSRNEFMAANAFVLVTR